MEKQINIQGKDYKLRSSLFTIISYRSTFGTEIFNDIKAIDKASKKKGEEDLSSIIETIFKITYILHKPFADKTYQEFTEEFDLSIIGDAKELEKIASAIGELIGSVNKQKK